MRADPDREEPAGVVRDAPVVLAGPADELLRRRLALRPPSRPRRPGRAVRPEAIELGAHLVYERFPVERHAVPPAVANPQLLPPGDTFCRLVARVREGRQRCTIWNAELPSPGQRDDDCAHGDLPARPCRGAGTRPRSVRRVLHRGPRPARGRTRGTARLPEGLGRARPPLGDPHRGRARTASSTSRSRPSRSTISRATRTCSSATAATSSGSRPITNEPSATRSASTPRAGT